MALQTSGPISLDDIHVEAGGTTGTTASMNDSDIRGLTAAAGRTINSTLGGDTDFSDYYGASSEVNLGDISTTQINGQDQLQQITVSTYISSGGTLRVPSSMWIWSDSTSVAAMIIDIPCTVINEGKIIGKGGAGGQGTFASGGIRSGGNGGPAISVTSTGVTIENSSGAYIAGGGGGGGGYQNASNPGDDYRGGGGGAGGGAGGNGKGYSAGSGGVLNATGANGGGTATVYAVGGGAGGAGGPSSSLAGAGGGRILPGVGGTAPAPNYSYLTAGGSAGNAGYSAGSSHAGGGGGWGASGASGGGMTGSYNNGGSGGAAITGTSRTLTNNGTIYGST